MYHLNDAHLASRPCSFASSADDFCAYLDEFILNEFFNRPVPMNVVWVLCPC